MKLSEVKEESKEVDEKILALIDLKTEDDMRQVILQLQSVERSIDTQLQSLKNTMTTTEKKHDVKFNLVLWVVGIAFTVIALILAIK